MWCATARFGAAMCNLGATASRSAATSTWRSPRSVNTMDVRTARTILRVVEILESGWLRLSGSDGNEIQVHKDNCAPCHLSNLVPARHGRGMPACKGCGSDSIAAPRLICDKCQAMWHVECAKAELHPGEEWLCPDCAPPLRR
eukprot:jgi/Tetstr1/457214/TSEL_043862.t1